MKSGNLFKHTLYGDAQWKCNFKNPLHFDLSKVLLNNPYNLESMDLVHSREAFSPQGELWALFTISIMRTACPTKRPAYCSLCQIERIILRPLCIKRSVITCDKRIHPKLSWDNFFTKFRTPNNTFWDGVHNYNFNQLCVLCMFCNKNRISCFSCVILQNL